MTSRREFFGLLAAAPVAVPAIAKEFASTAAAPKTPALLQIESLWLNGQELFQVNPRTFGLPRQRVWCEIDTERDNDINTAATPNRLYGAQINADGEAV